MKILFASEYYLPFTPGGSPWSIRALAEALVGRGHAVTIVTPNYGAPPRETTGGVTVVRFPFWRRLAPGASLASTKDLVSPRFHWKLYRAVAIEARRWRPDIIHAQDKHALVGSFFAARAIGRPVFLTLRDVGLICPIATCLLSHDFVPDDCSAIKLQRDCAGFYLDNYHVGAGRRRRARLRANLALLYADARLKRRLVARVDGLVSVSRGLLEIHSRAGYGAQQRSHVVYSLPPGPRKTPPDFVRAFRAQHVLEGREAVLYVGKLSLGKGWSVFRDAACQVAAKRPRTVFFVAGPDRPVPVSGADIRWLGQLGHEEMLSLYAAVELVVLPSVGPEALSRVPLEAAMAARPTIGARAGGIPEEILDGETGLLVDRNDPDALAERMLRLLEDRELRERLGREARRFAVKQFDPDAIVGSLVGLYEAARA